MQARAKAQAPKESYSDPCPKEFGFPWTSYGAGKAGEANARPLRAQGYATGICAGSGPSGRRGVLKHRALASYRGRRRLRRKDFVFF